ncbi:MAG TPA: aldo/keto reductase, partial [Kofleriaceae bacterium]|nr:aldo/keto reductase [Kofleriaceae bacterium]
MKRAVGLGCMRLSTDAARDDARALDVLRAGLDAGIDLLDTADAYALDDADLGHNERLIAQVIAGRRVEIVTKGGLERPGGAWVPNGRARHLAAAARASR